MTDEVLEWCRRLWHFVFLLWAAGVILCAVMLGGCTTTQGSAGCDRNALGEWVLQCVERANAAVDDPEDSVRECERVGVALHCPDGCRTTGEPPRIVCPIVAVEAEDPNQTQ